MPQDPQYTRKYALCRTFAADGTCPRKNCVYSHTLVDTARIRALVGDVGSPPSSSSFRCGMGQEQEQEKTYFQIEYTKYSASSDMDPADAEASTWRMRLLAGGRATLAALGTSAPLDSISVQPTYPAKGQGSAAGAALGALESRVFGRSPQPDPNRTTVCRALADSHKCPRGTSCWFSHTLFDTARIDALLADAVASRGYRDYRPILEVEYLTLASSHNGQKPAIGEPRFVWRITLRCVVSYAGTPQPVVATSAELGTAMALLEAQFAGSAASGTKPKSFDSTVPPSPSRPRPRPHQQQHTRFGSSNSNSNPTPNPHTSTRQNHHHQSPRGARYNRRRGASHSSTGTSSPSTSSTPSTNTNTPRAGPVGFPEAPPSYVDAMGGAPVPPTGATSGVGEKVGR